MSAQHLSQHPVHLGLGATAEFEPAFTGELAWYEAYAARHADDRHEGRLVSLHRFDAPWASWEMHPAGDEVVVCVEGRLTLIQQRADGQQQRIELGPGQCAINHAGVWHTADVDAAASALFITAGLGTEHRGR